MKSAGNGTPPAFWDVPLAALLTQLGASPAGLTPEEALARLRRHGPNSLARENRFGAVNEFFRLLANPLVLILLAAGVVSATFGDRVGAAIIIAIVIASVLLNYFQEYQARHTVEKLRQHVAATASTLRNGAVQDVAVSELVPGDIVMLNAGSLVPADARLLQANDLFLRESALTGESLPSAKTATDLVGGAHGITDATNAVFMGTAVQSGIGQAVVVRTGRATAFGDIAAKVIGRSPETEFDRGIRRFGTLITRVIMLLVLFVFLVNIVFKRPVLESFLFAIALAVGMTPELLPMIMTITLSRGARRMARKKVIVKQLASIENFGSIEILCSDKTGTLTMGEVALEQHVNVAGAPDDRVLENIYLNSFFEAGVKNPLDDAILRHSHPDIHAFHKIDEIPFDFDRRRLSVVVERAGIRTLITKGAAEDLFLCCSTVDMGGQVLPFDTELRNTAETTYRTLGDDGFRVLGVAVKTVPVQQAYEKPDETAMTLIGFAAFLDPTKEGVGAILQDLQHDGIAVLIMTGDNEHVTRKTARDVGVPVDRIIVGADMDVMDDAALAAQAEKGAIFARVSPGQKNRVITALKARGWVVGFLGDGINDAPSLHTADIGISVMNAVDVAKDAANIILLEKDLAVLHDGVVEGRRSFANILKYIIMGTSSNFGNMFSMAAASLFLPFLPMLPTQILLNNFLYDTSQITIPSDNVDESLLHRPRRWRVDFIRQFMLIMGPISSLYDFLMFGVLIYLFHANERLFHAGWFVESLATQTLVVFVIRTAGSPFRSRPGRQLAATVLAVVVIGAVLPFTIVGRWFGFAPLPLPLLAVIAVMTLTYLALVQMVKTWFYRRHALI